MRNGITFEYALIQKSIEYPCDAVGCCYRLNRRRSNRLRPSGVYRYVPPADCWSVRIIYGTRQGDEIRECIRWNRCSAEATLAWKYRGVPQSGVRAWSGLLVLSGAKAKKKVVVVGGGPAGWKRQRTAAQRVNEVYCWKESIGGVLRGASTYP